MAKIKIRVFGIVALLVTNSLYGAEFGGRSSEQIQSQFDKHSSNIFEFYLRTLRKTPDLQVRVTFEITVNENGEVSKCSWVNDKSSEESFNKGVCKRIEKINFGVGAQTEFNYPIHFFPT